jgi:hypothetical protein
MHRAFRHVDERPARDDLIGFHVETVGGPTGRIEAATRDANERYLVVRTGHWPMRHRVVVPAGAINCVDRRRRTLWVERDRDDVRIARLRNQDLHFAGERRPAPRFESPLSPKPGDGPFVLACLAVIVPASMVVGGWIGLAAMIASVFVAARLIPHTEANRPR